MTRYKINRPNSRSAFLDECALGTLELHVPIIDLDGPRISGHLNPQGLEGGASIESGAANGQTAVGFRTLAALREADRTGVSPYGQGSGRNKSAEYAIVRPHQVGAACEAMTALHCSPSDIVGGAGAVMFPSGLNAINATILALPHSHILLPEDVYGPAKRFIAAFNKDAGVEAIKTSFYGSRAGTDEVQAIFEQALAEKKPITTLYMEAPASHSFAIADIGGLARLAKSYDVPSVIDSSWGSHVRLKPLMSTDKGGIAVDVNLLSTTKHEGGYYDTPSGFAIARDPKWVEAIAEKAKFYGFGTTHPTVPLQLLHRLHDVEERLDRHFESGLKLSHWLHEQPFIKEVLNPALPTSPDHARFERFFGGKGNGLFTGIFADDISRDKADAFVDGLHLFVKAQSWGGHISLVTDSHVAPVAFRFHAGLEDLRDLMRDFEQSAAKVFDCRPALRQQRQLTLSRH